MNMLHAFIARLGLYMKTTDGKHGSIRMPNSHYTPCVAKGFDFNDCEIRKSLGSSAYIKSNGSTLHLNSETIELLKKETNNSGKRAVIRLNGLSRAQIGRIIRDLRRDNPASVIMEKVKIPSMTNGLANSYRYQIVIEHKDG